MAVHAQICGSRYASGSLFRTTSLSKTMQQELPICRFLVFVSISSLVFSLSVAATTSLPSLGRVFLGLVLLSSFRFLSSMLSVLSFPRSGSNCIVHSTLLSSYSPFLEFPLVSIFLFLLTLDTFVS